MISIFYIFKFYNLICIDFIEVYKCLFKKCLKKLKEKFEYV